VTAQKLWKDVWEVGSFEEKGKSFIPQEEFEVKESERFLTSIAHYLTWIEETSTFSDLSDDLAKMVACKAWPCIMMKASSDCLELDLPSLAHRLEEWATFLRITPVKYTEKEKAQKVQAERKSFGTEMLKAFGSAPSCSPGAILKSPCFHKDSETVGCWKTEMIDALLLTSKGSQWLSQAALQKHAFAQAHASTAEGLPKVLEEGDDEGASPSAFELECDLVSNYDAVCLQECNLGKTSNSLDTIMTKMAWQMIEVASNTSNCAHLLEEIKKPVKASEKRGAQLKFSQRDFQRMLPVEIGTYGCEVAVNNLKGMFIARMIQVQKEQACCKSWKTFLKEIFYKALGKSLAWDIACREAEEALQHSKSFQFLDSDEGWGSNYKEMIKELFEQPY